MKIDKIIGNLIISFVLSFIVYKISDLMHSDISCIENDGVSFGIGGYNFSLICSIFSLLIVFIYQSVFSKNITEKLCLSLITIGGLANLIERVYQKNVCDYWNFFNLFYFNLPDLIINLGISLFILSLFINFETNQSNLQSEC